jgi:hypothetical protein
MKLEHEKIILPCNFDSSIPNTNPQTFCQTLQEKLDNIVLGYALDKRAKFYAPFANTVRSGWATIFNPIDTVN